MNTTVLEQIPTEQLWDLIKNGRDYFMTDNTYEMLYDEIVRREGNGLQQRPANYSNTLKRFPVMSENGQPYNQQLNEINKFFPETNLDYKSMMNQTPQQTNFNQNLGALGGATLPKGLTGLLSALYPSTAQAPETSEFQADSMTPAIISTIAQNADQEMLKTIPERVGEMLPFRPEGKTTYRLKDRQTPLSFEDILNVYRRRPNMSEGMSNLTAREWIDALKGSLTENDLQRNEWEQALSGSQKEAEDVNRSEWEQALAGSQEEAEDVNRSEWEDALKGSLTEKTLEPKKENMSVGKPKSFDEWKNEMKAKLAPKKDIYETPEDVNAMVQKLTNQNPQDEQKYVMPNDILAKAAQIAQRATPKAMRQQIDTYQLPADIQVPTSNVDTAALVKEAGDLQKQQAQDELMNDSMRARMLFGERGNL